MKDVIIVIPDGQTNLSTVTGSFEVLNSANSYWKNIRNQVIMNIRIAGFMMEQQLNAGYFTVHPIRIEDIKRADLLIIPAVFYHEHLAEENSALIGWIREQYKNGAEIAAMCSGVFLLASTGLLKGKVCSTNWQWATDFKRIFPNIDLCEDKLVTYEDGIYTNGGAYSFLNLMLFVVEKYFDRETAIYCSKIFQIDVDRMSQSPFFIFQTQKDHGDELICKAQTYIEENLTEKISIGQIALKFAISRRNFDRRFIKATGNTPVEYVQRVKIEAAKIALEKGRKTILEIMYEVGYSDSKAFREVFKRVTGLSPLDYKARYNKESIFFT